MSSGEYIVVMIVVALGYSSAVTWVCRTGVSRRIWIVTAVGILVIASLGVADWRRQGSNIGTPLGEYLAEALIPTIAVSWLIARLRRQDVRPALQILAGSILWVAGALFVLSLSFLYNMD